MKFVFVMTATLLAGQAFAVQSKCYKKAERAVRYAGERVEAYDCRADRQLVFCDVAAYKSDGAASDTWLVVMNKPCTRVLRTELTGEE